MFAAADTLLVLHIGGGTLGMMSGTVAAVARKGGKLHQDAGKLFLFSMLAMAGVGAAVAPFLNDRPSTIAGILTFYLVLTGWLTLRRSPRQAGAVEFGGLLVASCVAAAGIFFMQLAAHSPTHTVDGVPPQSFYLFVIVGGIAALSDLKVLVSGGIAGPQRIARHLWRMFTALAIATGSFFLGQQKVMPEFMRGSPLLFIPAFAPLVLMFFWLGRTRLTKSFHAFVSSASQTNRLEAV
jgi:hypothetical protein